MEIYEIYGRSLDHENPYNGLNAKVPERETVYERQGLERARELLARQSRQETFLEKVIKEWF